MIRIILAESKKLISDLICDFLSQHNLFNVIATTSSGDEAVKLYKQHNPDIMIFDVSLDELNGIEATERILNTNPDAKIIFLSIYDHEAIIQQCFRIGARGFVSRCEAPSKLRNAIKIVHYDNGSVFPISGAILEKRNGNGNEITGIENGMLRLILSKREYEIFQLLGQGLLLQEIAKIYCISKRTVECHERNIKQKLGISNTNKLVSIASRHNLIYSYGWVE